MTEFEDPNDHILISSEYVPAGSKYPATLDLAWYDETKARNVYETLQGSAAKKLSHLKQGDIYHSKEKN